MPLGRDSNPAFFCAGKDCHAKLTLTTVHHRDGAIYCNSHKPYDKPVGNIRS